IAYNHWNDGTIRNIAQTVPGADTASTILTRDYDYESSLKDSTTNYSKTAITIPIRFGLKFELSDHFDVRISAAYIITTTDFIDNVSGGGNDNLFYTSFGLQYNFAKPSNGDDKFKDFDFADLDKDDSDEDGVPDHKDLCQGTPKNVKVDNKGCALDDDMDGVPNYRDKELNTPGGTLVNKEGVTLTDKMMALQESLKDSVETEYRVFKADDLSQEEIDEIQRQYAEANNSGTNAAAGGISMPEKFKGLDTDKDNYISAKEVTNAIDGFFEGENDLSAKDLNKLIDFYFDQ
ncbi:MAG: hypothetical protein HRT73_14230, partial [Flavobacteriales bacterium]|nr:hypothetical protein [Flavobacteriales bacterium]